MSKDDAARAITYSIVDGVPIESHEATITVTACGRRQPRHLGGRRRPGRDGRPDGQGVYQQSLEALKAHVEG